MNSDATDLLPKRTIISIFPNSELDDANLFVRSLMRYNIVAHAFPNLDTLYQKRESIQDDATVLLVDPRKAILLRDPTALFSFYEQMDSGKTHHYLYSASPKYEATLASLATQSQEELMPGLCIMTGLMLKDLVQYLYDAYGEKLHEQRTLTEQDLRDYVRARGVQVQMDKQRRFLVYPKYRIDVGTQIDIQDGKIVFANSNGNWYDPYILTRCENGELRSIAKKLNYTVPDRAHDIIADNLERWYKAVKSHFV